MKVRFKETNIVKKEFDALQSKMFDNYRTLVEAQIAEWIKNCVEVPTIGQAVTKFWLEYDQVRKEIKDYDEFVLAIEIKLTRFADFLYFNNYL